MTVIQPNSVAGINSITVQSGNSLAVHKANGELIRTITSNSGVSTFSSISVGTAATTNSAGKSINIGLGASISQHVDNSLSFGTGGDERARIDSSGRLLIGHTATTSKDRQVQLVGTTADGSSYMALRHSADANGSRLDLCKSRNATPGSNTIVVDDDVLGSIDFLGDDGTDIQSVGASIVAQVDGTPGSNDMPGRLIFRTTADGAAASTERLRITSGGYVGVGEDSPATILHVKADVGDLLRLDRNNTGAVGNQIAFRHSASGTLTETGSINCLSTANADTGQLKFYTKLSGGSNTEKLRITSNGHLVIGGDSSNTFAGLQRLDIFNTSTADNYHGSLIRLITKNAAGNATASYDMVKYKEGTVSHNNNESSGAINFYAGGATRLQILSTGNINVNDGDVVLASGHGIDFSATAPSGGSMSNELLDDYEEGTFTPILYYSSGTSGVAYNVQEGRYTKVGRLVSFQIRLALSNKGSGNNNVRIGGLPFTPETGGVNYDYFMMSAVVGCNLGAGRVPFAQMEDYSAGRITLYSFDYASSNNYAEINNSSISSNFNMGMQGNYITAS